MFLPLQHSALALSATWLLLTFVVQTKARDSVIRTAVEVDRLVELELRNSGTTTADLATDEDYLRRVTLDLIGTLPSSAEVILFGRTPPTNPRGGRDHFPHVFNMLLAGGGVRGGQVIGSSTAAGNAVQDRPVSVHDLFCSVCHSVRVDPRSEVTRPLGRPMKIVDGGETELFS